MALKIHPKQFGNKLMTLVGMFALVLQPLYAVVASQVANADSGIIISNISELRDAVEHQADGQTWTIEPGNYGVAAFDDITVQGQTGWYLPVTANNLTINGVGDPTLYGTGYTANGNWSTQNFVSVFGNNVTINGLTLMPKVEPNKTIEVLGSDFTLENSTIEPNTLTDPSEYNSIADPQDRQDEKDWGGSLYFSHEGNHTIKNVTIKNAGVSFRYAPSGTHIDFDNVKLDYATNVDWINGYRYSSGFNNSGNSLTGAPSVDYHVTNTLANLDDVLANTHDSDTIDLDSDLPVVKQLTLAKAVTFNGNGHTLSPTFAKTDNDNNSAVSVQSSNVTVKNLIEDGVAGTNLHGINVFGVTGVALNDVTVKNNDHSGVNVNGSTVTVNNITTEGNGWDGVDVDKAGAVLTVNGVSHHTEAVADIYVDNSSVGQVVDTNNQYGIKNNVLQAGDRVYDLKPSVPTATLFDANNAQVTAGGYITTPSFTFHLSSSADVTRYQLKYWNSVPGSGFNGESNAWTPTDISAAGHMSTLGLYTDNFTQGEGTHYFAFSACNASGICSDFSVPFAVTYDKTAPAAPTNLGWKTSTNVTVANNGATNVSDGTASWQDSSSDIDHYVYKYWNDISGNPYKVGNEYTVSTASTSLPGVFNQGEGVHHFCVEAVDHAGNTSSCTQFTITYDATAPGVPVLTFPSNNAYINTNNFWFDWNDVADATKYEVQYSQNPAVNGDGSFQHVDWTGDYQQIQPTDSTAHSVGANGTWYWQVRAIDAAGNTSAWSAPWKVTIDMDAPAAPTLTSPANGAIVQGASITQSWADSSSDVDHYVYESYNDAAATNLRFNGTFTATSKTATNVSDATYYWRVKAVDHAGNVSSWSPLWKITVDNIAPVVALSDFSADSNAITPNITATDANNPLTYLWTADDSDSADNVDVSDPTVAQPTFTANSDGTYNFTLTTTDPAGNVTTKAFSFTYTAPVAPTTPAPTARAAVVTSGTSTPATNFANVTFVNGTPTTDDTSGVLGAQTQKTDNNSGSKDGDVLGATATPKQSSDGQWHILGLNWYWWVPIVAVAAGIVWWFFAARRRNGEA